MNDRLSRWVAAWLAHPTGVLQALGTTVIWLATPFLGWSWHDAVFWYLGYCTFISFATQFTLAYQNRKAEAAQELTLRNMVDLMNLNVTLARKIDEALVRLDEGVDKLIAFATTEQQIQDAIKRQDEGIASTLAAVLLHLEARQKLRVPLSKLLPEGPDEEAEPGSGPVLPVDGG